MSEQESIARLRCALHKLAVFATALDRHLDDDDNLIAFGPMDEWGEVLDAFAPFFDGETMQ